MIGVLPEQRPVTPMRDDVIDVGGRLDSTAALALDTQRMLAQIRRSVGLPLAPVATGVTATARFVHRAPSRSGVDVAQPTALDERAAAWARRWRFSRHGLEHMLRDYSHVPAHCQRSGTPRSLCQHFPHLSQAFLGHAAAHARPAQSGQRSMGRQRA